MMKAGLIEVSMPLTSSSALAQEHGVIDDPTGYVDLRSDKLPDAAFIAKIKTGAPNSFECKEGDKWSKITRD